MSDTTPLPWVVGGPYPSVSVCFVAEHGTSEEPDRWEAICVLDSKTDGAPNKQALADATLIVRAVNAHQALVNACQAALAAMEHMGDALNDMDAVVEEDEKHFATFEAVRAALELARKP